MQEDEIKALFEDLLGRKLGPIVACGTSEDEETVEGKPRRRRMPRKGRDADRVVAVLANPLLMHQERRRALVEQFRWKAENNIRFYDKLDMTTEQKVQFLAEEFASVYWLGEMHRLDWPDAAQSKTEPENEGVRDK